jgi:hypothetical protein
VRRVIQDDVRVLARFDFRDRLQGFEIDYAHARFGPVA